MATVYVRNVPEALYDALRKRARANHRTIRAEFLEILSQNIPTAKQLRARRKLSRKNHAIKSEG
jgi:plasmid stability protein